MSDGEQHHAHVLDRDRHDRVVRLELRTIQWSEEQPITGQDDCHVWDFWRSGDVIDAFSWLMAWAAQWLEDV